MDFEKTVIKLPKLKGIKAVLHREFSGEVKTVTVKRAPSGKYFASVLVEDSSVETTPTTIDPDYTIGLDVGLNHMLIDSNGDKIDNPKYLKRDLERLAYAQKRLALCKKGSNNWAKQKRKVAILHEKVANRRSDFIHQVTAKLAGKSHATSFAVEDLNIKGMLKNRKLSRSIADASWGTFITTLDYRCRLSGKNLIRIGRFQPSSKLCNSCGHKMESLSLSVRSWKCPSCGACHDRDVNAAKNIKHFALADALGHSVCINGTPMASPDSSGVIARGVEVSQHGSQEAPTRTVLAV